MESPKRPSKLIFVVLNFVTAIRPGALHCSTRDDVIDTCARDLLCSLLSDRRILVLKTPSAGLLLLANTVVNRIQLMSHLTQ